MIAVTLLAGYAGLFVAAFIAATILPAQSEVLLATMLMSGRFDAATLLTVATAGNVLGSVVNWALGRYFAHYRERRWFPASPAAMDRGESWFARFGPAVLLLSWVPVVGDPLTVIAGVLKMRLLPFLLVVTIAKGGRYLILTAATLGWLA